MEAKGYASLCEEDEDVGRLDVKTGAEDPRVDPTSWEEPRGQAEAGKVRHEMSLEVHR